MSFIDYYIKIVKNDHTKWDVPDKNKEHFKSLYELSEVFDEVIPKQLHLQEASDSIGPLVAGTIQSKPTLSKGVSTGALAQVISSALSAEVIPQWSTIWKLLKATAATITPTPPPSLDWQAPSPAGTGTPYPEGTIFQSTMMAGVAPFSKGVDSFSALVKAMTEFIKDEYKKHGKASGPPVYKPV